MNALTRVARVEAQLAPEAWPWRDDNRDLIARHWEARRAATGALYDGRVLMVAQAGLREDECRVRFFETDYSALLAWKEHGFHEGDVANGFAMGALLGTDGGFILGRMAQRTANAGRMYFPCGTPDLSDVRPGGAVDLAGSLVREIEEETGLSPDLYRVEPGWTVVRDGGLMAFIRLARLSMSAEEARLRILDHLAGEAEPELDDITVVRRVADIAGANVPGVVPLYLRWAFGDGPVEPATPAAQG